MKFAAIEPMKTNTGFPYAGGAPVEVDESEVVAFGKLRSYGDFVTRFLLRLRDGREVFVIGTLQTEAAAKWLRKMSKKTHFTAYPNRESGWVFAWEGVVPPALQRCCAAPVPKHDGLCNS